VVATSIVAAVLATVSVMGAAACTINSKISDLFKNPPSPAYAIVVLCLPALVFCTAAAWKRLVRAGLVPTMANTQPIAGSQVAAASDEETVIFPAKGGGTEQRTL
jgi:hypothetical protein